MEHVLTHLGLEVAAAAHIQCHCRHGGRGQCGTSTLCAAVIAMVVATRRGRRCHWQGVAMDMDMEPAALQVHVDEVLEDALLH